MGKPPVSDHTNYEESVVAYDRWSLTIVQLQGGFFSKRGPDSPSTPHILKRIKRT